MIVPTNLTSIQIKIFKYILEKGIVNDTDLSEALNIEIAKIWREVNDLFKKQILLKIKQKNTITKDVKTNFTYWKLSRESINAYLIFKGELKFESEIQKKIYNYLKKNGSSRRKDIYENINVARSTVYDNLEKLRVKGIVKRKKIKNTTTKTGLGAPFIYWKLNDRMIKLVNKIIESDIKLTKNDLKPYLKH